MSLLFKNPIWLDNTNNPNTVIYSAKNSTQCHEHNTHIHSVTLWYTLQITLRNVTSTILTSTLENTKWSKHCNAFSKLVIQKYSDVFHEMCSENNFLFKTQTYPNYLVISREKNLLFEKCLPNASNYNVVRYSETILYSLFPLLFFI